MKSPPKMARAIRAAMVSFRVLLFISASQEFGEQGTDSGDTTKTESDNDPVDQNLFAAFYGKVWRGLIGRRGGIGFTFGRHIVSLHCIAKHDRMSARLRADGWVRSELLQAKTGVRGLANRGGSTGAVRASGPCRAVDESPLAALTRCLTPCRAAGSTGRGFQVLRSSPEQTLALRPIG